MRVLTRDLAPDIVSGNNKINPSRSPDRLDVDRYSSPGLTHGQHPEHKTNMDVSDEGIGMTLDLAPEFVFGNTIKEINQTP